MRAVAQEGVSRSQGQVETQERKGLFSPARRPEAALGCGPHPACRLLLDTLGWGQVILPTTRTLPGLTDPVRGASQLLETVNCPCSEGQVRVMSSCSGHHGPGPPGPSLLRDGQREARAGGGGRLGDRPSGQQGPRYWLVPSSCRAEGQPLAFLRGSKALPTLWFLKF